MTENEKILAELLQNVHSWTELKPKLSEYNTSTTDTTAKTTRAGKLFEYFTKLCFLHDSEFSEEYNCKDIYLYDEIPTNLKQKLNLPKVEHGIDLLIVDRDEQTIAVQCKFKNNETVKLNWNADKLGNFFGFARNANLHCIFSNSSDITQVAQNLTDNFKFFSYSHLQNISAATFEKMRNALIGEPIKEREKPEPHDFQQEAIEAVINHFKDNERGQLILPCGAGKTFTSLWIKEKLQATNTLVLVPSLALLRQIKSNWNEAYNTKFIRLNVCSERDIDADIDNDIAITHTYEIPGNVTSDKNLVASFLKREDNKVIFSTYQSLQVVVDALQLLPNFYFDLIIADEAHKTAGFEDQNKFTLVHNNEKVRGVKRLYMTATPRIASPELKAKHSGRIVFLKDMSNPKVYGKEAYRMTFGAAIEKGILVKYKIIAVGVSDTDLKNYIERNIQLTTSESITDYAHNYALNIVMEKYKAFHALTFHSRINNAVSFSKRHNRLVPDAVSTSISGTQTTSEREIILKAFERANKGVVSNAKCLTEGVDVPVIDVVYYSDPKNSKIDIVQSAGRALRKAKHRNKEWGFIVVPIFHKDRETVEDAIDKSDYRNLITVIRSLCDQDERLVSEINELAWEKEYKKRKATIEVTFSDDQTNKVIQFEEIKEKLRNALFNQVIETLKDSWEIHYKEVEEYFNANGHSNIPARYKTMDGFGLGTWCVSQRVNYNKGLLSDGEIKKLQKLNFDFDPNKSLFESDFKKLLEFKEMNGHVNVPTMGSTLGRKVNRLRTYYRKGMLNPERIEKLNSIGFQFTFDDAKSWEERFEELKEYYEAHNVKQVNSAINSSLYFWERRQREINSKGKLEQDQIKKLNNIGFNWEVITKNNKDIWNEKYSLLEGYFEKFGTSNIPTSSPFFQPLRRFIGNNRINFKKGKLSSERVKMLQEVQFDFSSYKSQEDKEHDWKNKYQQLVDSINLNGSFNIKPTIENKDLIKWIKSQRKSRVSETLSTEKIYLLDEISFPWSGRIYITPKKETKSNDARWEEMYEYLVNFKLLKNTCIVSDVSGDKDLQELKRWTISQRSRFKRNKMSDERILKLNAIEFPWIVGKGVRPKKIKENSKDKTSHDAAWAKMFEVLKEYSIQFNTFKIDKVENKLLNTWCSTQRTKYNMKRLPVERISQLNSIGFPWKLPRGKVKTKEVINRISKDKKWEEMFEKLVGFYNTNKHFTIQETKEFAELKGWINTQIVYRRKGKIQQSRLQKLNAINFIWSKAKLTSDGKKVPKALSPKQEKDWLEMFQKLISFALENGHSIIPRNNAENERLSQWLGLQRKNFRENKLPKDKIEKFEQLSIDLTYNKADELRNRWMRNYNKLAEYFKLNRHSNFPTGEKENKQIADWVLVQRRERKKGELEDYKIEELNKINFNWENVLPTSNGIDKHWQVKFDLLVKYKEQFNSVSVPQSNKEIGRWVNDQRVNFQRDKLSPQKIKMLNEIGFIWVAKKS